MCGGRSPKNPKRGIAGLAQVVKGRLQASTVPVGIQAGISEASLNQAHVRLVELRPLGEGFPAQFLRHPVPLQHDGERIR
jgi:hypothetical protein